MQTSIYQNPPIACSDGRGARKAAGEGGGHSTNGKIPIVTRFCESWHMKHVAGSHPLGSAMVVTALLKAVYITAKSPAT